MMKMTPPHPRWLMQIDFSSVKNARCVGTAVQITGWGIVSTWYSGVFCLRHGDWWKTEGLEIPSRHGLTLMRKKCI